MSTFVHSCGELSEEIEPHEPHAEEDRTAAHRAVNESRTAKSHPTPTE